jgi:hypothetical protein
MPKVLVNSSVGIGLMLVLSAIACGSTTESPKATTGKGGGGSAGSSPAGTAGSPAGGVGSGSVMITDGSERCTDLRATGTFAGAPLQGSTGWTSFNVWTSEAPWRGSFSWQGHALELRGQLSARTLPYEEGSLLKAEYGYMVRADATPWQATCLTSASTVRMVNANDVLDLELALAAECAGTPGPDQLDLCVASPDFGGNDPQPPCARGVTGVLGGQAAPIELNPLASTSGETGAGATTLTFGKYVVRMPLAGWSLDSTAAPREFSGGLLAVERGGAFDLYCVATGRAQPKQITLSGVSRLVSCDAAATRVESAQLCHWNFTRED